MSDVAVIGLGEMGAALANAFITAGHEVTVWNRSPQKAVSLRKRGAQLAADVADAISAAPIVVICVSDYAVTSSILASAGAEEALRGRLVVQLSSGIPKQARTLAEHVHRAGGTYLDGAIAAWPRQIGTAEAAIFISGPQDQFDAAKPILAALAGGLTHIGTDIAIALALFNAALSYFAGHWIGFSYGAAICQAEGLPVDAFGDMLAGLSPSLATDLQHMGRVITSGSYATPETTLVTAGTDIGRLVELADDLKIGNAWPIFAGSTFQQAIRAGFGTEEHCAIIKVLSHR